MTLPGGIKDVLVNECEVCGKPTKAVQVKGKGQRGTFWVCDDGHKSRTRKFYTKILKS